MINQLAEKNGEINENNKLLDESKKSCKTKNDDKLERYNFAKKIINFIDKDYNFANGFTSLLNGDFGSGKSTVFNFIENSLNEENYSKNILPIRINIWENNFYDNPLVTILYGIHEGFDKLDKSFKLKEIFKKYGFNIIKNSIKNLLASKNIIIEKESTIFDELDKYKTSINTLKKDLNDFIKTSNSKIIILLDEMDRCLPEYQIKVLETIYNIFDINDLFIIIACDKLQLEHNIKQKFGENMNINGYIAKFIDYEFNLPYKDNIDMKLLSTLISSKQIKFFNEFFDYFGISLRKKINILQKYNLIMPNRDYGNKADSITFFILIFKIYFNELFVLLNRNMSINYNLDIIIDRFKKISINKKTFYNYIKTINQSKILLLFSFFIDIYDKNNINKLKTEFALNFNDNLLNSEFFERDYYFIKSLQLVNDLIVF